MSYCLAYIPIYERTNSLVTNIKPFCFGEFEVQKSWKGIHLLEITMRNLIVELQVFKADNEKLKKAQQE
jgi:hypothetical protein